MATLQERTGNIRDFFVYEGAERRVPSDGYTTLTADISIWSRSTCAT